MEVKFTNGIPICPYCQKPTRRQSGISMSTCIAFPPIFDENGNNTNPDRNNTTTDYKCFECNKEYGVCGNYIDGHKYVGLKTE